MLAEDSVVQTNLAEKHCFERFRQHEVNAGAFAALVWLNVEKRGLWMVVLVTVEGDIADYGQHFPFLHGTGRDGGSWTWSWLCLK